MQMLKVKHAISTPKMAVFKQIAYFLQLLVALPQTHNIAWESVLRCRDGQDAQTNKYKCFSWTTADPPLMSKMAHDSDVGRVHSRTPGHSQGMRTRKNDRQCHTPAQGLGGAGAGKDLSASVKITQCGWWVGVCHLAVMCTERRGPWGPAHYSPPLALSCSFYIYILAWVQSCWWGCGGTIRLKRLENIGLDE